MIFLGSAYGDPWINEFDAQREFTLGSVAGPNGRLCFVNKSPRPGERSRYCSRGENGSTDESYGLVTFLPNLRNTGNILILEGTNAEGTEAIGDFIAHLSSSSEIYQYLGLADRRPFAYFELLFKTAVLGNGAGKLEVIAHRVIDVRNYSVRPNPHS